MFTQLSADMQRMKTIYIQSSSIWIFAQQNSMTIFQQFPRKHVLTTIKTCSDYTQTEETHFYKIISLHHNLAHSEI